MLAGVDEPLVWQVRQDRADVAQLIGEHGARLRIGGAGLDLHSLAKRADPGHGLGVEQVAGDDIFAGARAELEHRDGLLAIGDENPGPGVAVARILGALVHAAILVPVQRHVGGRRDGDPAALGNEAAVVGPGEAGGGGRRAGRCRGRRRFGRGEARPGEEGDDRQQEERSAGPAQYLRRLRPVLDQHDAGPAEGDERQSEAQDGERQAVLPALLDLGDRALAFVAGLERGAGRRRLAGAGLGVAALRILPQPIGHGDAFGGHRLERLARLAEEGGELAVGDGEGEGRIAALVAGDERVDAQHPPALIEQRPARMALAPSDGTTPIATSAPSAAWATTWALVTTRFGATAKPEPWPKPDTSPSSKAMTTTRTTERPAAEMSSARAGAASAARATRNASSRRIVTFYGARSPAGWRTRPNGLPPSTKREYVEEVEASPPRAMAPRIRESTSADSSSVRPGSGSGRAAFLGAACARRDGAGPATTLSQARRKPAAPERRYRR